MAAKSKAKAKEQASVLLTCDRERCDYVVYGTKEFAAVGAELMEDHLLEHDDPEAWKAKQEADT